jgi:hypothetical protein
MHTEAEHLVQADRHIAEAEQRISDQERRLTTLEAAGGDTIEGMRLLHLFRSVLTELQVHRQLILDNLARG